MIDSNKQNVVRATISIKALIVAWLSIPALYIIPYIFVYLPKYIKMKIEGEIESAIREAAGLGEKISVSDIVKQEIYGAIPPIVTDIIGFFVGLLFFAWFCWAIGYTVKHFKYKLHYDEKELYGKSGKKELTVSLDKINNIYIEDSIWGKLFNYGSITISSTVGSITIKNVAGARAFAKRLASVSIENENNFTNL